ncbi:uncharacterized protein PAC_10206 [Phialocephala subalpina]|uniref:Uncharacterized protein n=1 Tax=Phialocephala subalpina TaxID=576137 RepID=A0A1L7X5K3_9HELO|nr:uncharacterized protein PAC_10206 [Phialocephala subalpina]
MGPQDIYHFVVDWVYYFANNFHRNLFHMFDDMNTTRYIRLIACVGAYLLARPYLVKLGEKISQKELEKQNKAKDPYDAATKEKGDKKKIEPNALRGGGKSVSFEEVEKEEDDEGEASGFQWGKKAKQRARKEAEKKLAAQEKVLQDDDIMEHLVDYEPGQDGW